MSSGLVDNLIRTVNDAAQKLAELSDEEASKKTNPEKWSKKEILGHLIDSASNNHQRFVRAQFKEDLIFPGYEQNKWVTAQDYQNQDWVLLIELWKNLNLHIAHVMKNIPDEIKFRKISKHNFHEIAWQTVAESEETTLAYFMEDYVEHLQPHLKQVLR